jgi:hypothetical protein
VTTDTTETIQNMHLILSKNKLTYGKTNETVAGTGFSDRGWMMNGKGTLHISK